MKKALMVTLAAAVVVSLAGSFAQDKKAPAPVNAKCPLSGKEVKADCASEVKVSFCCGNCKGKFDKEPVSLLVKVDKVPNEKCPASGKAVAADASSSVAVAFCCGECKGKFDKEPGKYLGKVEAKK
jgi:YHS domain-containing protein